MGQLDKLSNRCRKVVQQIERMIFDIAEFQKNHTYDCFYDIFRLRRSG
jgi:hypothetical protein